MDLDQRKIILTVKVIRESGLTQQRIATLAGINANTITAILMGRQGTRNKTASRLLAVCGYRFVLSVEKIPEE